MTGETWILILACSLFVGSHLLISHPPVRDPLRRRIGKYGFRGGYSLISIASLTWMIMTYGDAPRTVLWNVPVFIRHGSLTVMVIAIFLIICGVTTANPGMIDMEEKGLKNGAIGILKITRHPVSWGIALWGVSHGLANGHLEGIIFFGSFAALSLIGASHIDYRKSRRLGDRWRDFMDVTSHAPFGAILRGRVRVEKGEIRWWQTLLTIVIFTGLLLAHETFFGQNVLPM